MAISLAGKRRAGQKRTTSKRLAKEYEAQSRRAQKRKGWSGLLGGVGGKLLGTALAGMTGGLAAPLLMAAGTFGGKIAAHKLTGAMGMGAKTGGLKGDIYGYGKEEATTLKKGLESQMAVDPLKEGGAFGKDLLSSYVGAGMAGELGGAKAFLKGGKGAPTFGEALFGGEGTTRGLAGAKEAIFGKAAEEVYSPLYTDDPASKVLEGSEYTGLPFESEEPYVFGSEMVSEEIPYMYDDTAVSEELPVQVNAQGGQVMDQQQLMQLLALAQMQQQDKAYDNTPLEEEKQQSTISDMFASQGKTLGGNNIQSLSQILGR